MVDKIPADITPGSASRGSVVHASDAGLADLSRAHSEEDISRLQSAFNTYSVTLTYNIGDIVKEDDFFYRCITAVVSPEVFDSNKWEFISNEVSMFITSYNLTAAGQNNFYPVNGAQNANNATETRVQAPAADDVIFIDFLLTVQANSRPDTTEWAFRIDSVDGNGLINVGGGLTGNFEDLSGQDPAARGQQLSYQVRELVTTTGAITVQGSAVKYVRD